MTNLSHEPELISTIAIGLSAAFVGGLIAQQLRLPVIVGYLIAGMAVGPFTPGLEADSEVAAQLAEMGVILLMFGVGIHFSIADLLVVRRLAVPGALGQVLIATSLGMGLALWWGWGVGAGLVMGLALSVASTVVLLRGLSERGNLETEAGRTAVGWLVVEDLIVVVVLVLLPALADPLGGRSPSGAESSVALTLAITLGKVALFVALMMVVGMRVVPRLLTWVESTGSRELFILATLATALGVAFTAAELFDVSFALGAFLAGVLVNESEVSHRAAEEALPLREAFAVLFFVSVGMLIDPSFLVDEVARLAAVVAIVVVGKALAALLIVKALGGSLRTGLTVAVGLAQIGEFSFILLEMGRSLELLPEQTTGLLLAAALISITINPLLFRALDPLERLLSRRGAAGVGRALGLGRST